MDYKSVKRVMVYRIGSLGDFMVSLPCLHLIARTFPNAERLLLTNFPVNAKAPAAAEVLANTDLIHGYIRYEAGTRNPIELLKIWCTIVRFRPQIVFYLMPQRRPSAVRRDVMFFRAAGVRKIIGLPDPNDPAFTADPKTGLYQKEAFRLASTIARIGDAQPEDLANWDLRLSESEKNNAAHAVFPLRGNSFVVCGPGTKWDSKDWGLENWASLLRKLSADLPDSGLVLVGGNADRAAAEALLTAWPNGNSINLCGRMTPRETAAVISRALLFLGPDSGPMHLAAATGVPCAIAFSAQGKLGAWFPVGQNHQIVYRRTECAGCEGEICVERQKECLLSISVNQMHNASLEALRPK